MSYGAVGRNRNEGRGLEENALWRAEARLVSRLFGRNAMDRCVFWTGLGIVLGTGPGMVFGFVGYAGFRRIWKGRVGFWIRLMDGLMLWLLNVGLLMSGGDMRRVWRRVGMGWRWGYLLAVGIGGIGIGSGMIAGEASEFGVQLCLLMALWCFSIGAVEAAHWMYWKRARNAIDRNTYSTFLDSHGVVRF